MTQTPSFSVLTRRVNDADHPVLRQLENHWFALQNNGAIPLRKDVDPSAIDTALPWTFVLQRVAPGVARMRVAGQKLHDILRMDPRGMPLSAFFNTEDQSTLAVHLEMAFTDPAVVALPLYVPATLFGKKNTGQILFMPLEDGQGEVSRLLGALVTERPLGLRNKGLRIDAANPTRYVPITQKGRQTTKPNASRRPALSLVVDNG